MSELLQSVPTEKDMESLPIVGDQPRSEAEEAHLREMCTYEFYNTEEPGLSITFPYGSTKNKRNFKFFHGGKYRVPRHVARHVENCAYPLWEYRPDGRGHMEKQRIGVKSRFQMRQVYGE